MRSTEAWTSGGRTSGMTRIGGRGACHRGHGRRIGVGEEEGEGAEGEGEEEVRRQFCVVWHALCMCDCCSMGVSRKSTQSCTQYTRLSHNKSGPSFNVINLILLTSIYQTPSYSNAHEYRSISVLSLRHQSSLPRGTKAVLSFANPTPLLPRLPTSERRCRSRNPMS